MNQMRFKGKTVLIWDEVSGDAVKHPIPDWLGENVNCAFQLMRIMDILVVDAVDDSEDSLTVIPTKYEAWSTGWSIVGEWGHNKKVVLVLGCSEDAAEHILRIIKEVEGED